MKVFSFSQQGKRSNNEDYCDYNERLWMVCDGVGGHVSGERASRFVVENMLNEFQQEVPGLNKKKIQECLDKVQVSLNHVLDSEPELERMGTTFTGIFKTDTYWYAAHIGDSRIYLFRPAEKKLWHTWDHSLVGEMMRHHDITREEGRFHPMSNRISKAIIANTEGKINTASIATIDELNPGDFFLLCSDGVVEAWGDQELTHLFSDPNLTFEQKGEKLREQCGRLSKDNNTALLLQVEAADAFSFGHNEELTWVSFQEIDADYQAYQHKIKAEQEDPDDMMVDLSDFPAQDEDASDVASVAKAAPSASPAPPVPPAPRASDVNVPDTADKNSIKRLKTAVYLLITAIVIAGVFMIVRQFTAPKADKVDEESNTNLIVNDNGNNNPDMVTPLSDKKETTTPKKKKVEKPVTKQQEKEGGPINHNKNEVQTDSDADADADENEGAINTENIRPEKDTTTKSISYSKVNIKSIVKEL